MHIFEHNTAVADIYNLSISLLIGKDFAEQMSGKTLSVEHQNSEQANRRRELLAVEEEANKQKIIDEHGQNYFKTQVMNKFFEKVHQHVDEQFSNKEDLYKNTVGVEDAAPSILEVLCLNAATIKRIVPLVKTLPWLSKDVLSLVNKPQYRKRADVQVSDPSLALSYVGLDNLKLIIPTYILKHILPKTTSPFALMKRKLWNESLSIGLAASVLAEEKGLDKFSAFTAGMFGNIGKLVVTRCCLQSYNELHRAELKEAYDNKDKKLHDVLTEFDSSPEFILKQILSRSDKTTAELIEIMRFDRLQITEPLFDLAFTNNFDKLTPIAQIISKARAYVAYRSLAKEELITKEQSQALLAAVHMTANDIALLKKSDIDHIKLVFN